MNTKLTVSNLYHSNSFYSTPLEFSLRTGGITKLLKRANKSKLILLAFGLFWLNAINSGATVWIDKLCYCWIVYLSSHDYQ